MNAESWADLELLDHIIRGGTLSAAARTLGVDQTTIARRLAALERRIGAALFDRIGGRLTPTPVLATVLDRLQTISEEASLSMAALKRATAELHGHVRMTSVSFVLAHIIAPALGELERSHPGITLDLVADDQALSFERREADIAVRLGRTGEDTTRIKRIGAIRFRLCRPAGLLPGEHPVVRYRDTLAHVPEMLALDRARPEARVVLTADKLEILTEAALALGAEVMLPELSVRHDPRFEIVDEPATVADRPAYLMIHPERARVPSVAAVAAFVEAAVHGWRP
ncbi:LysR family transcriptional regulator [Sinorhizobium mexicanum]|uniref:LysR family transcriptional regulator n=1 Tax=Sinorhizobium mexicanum TaxID=375549 RepID=A0A859QHZ3_9HYPH|nr:LysR family transcriptional regulator [Sinorhizobium mexicanum]MBP1887508.1 DNA-binding transcriptional LysR family regulator [Sinorhizobium mexicanum]QLL62395.1 LysR family transcriptional regulator [Sinorhizobium mexicanum]